VRSVSKTLPDQCNAYGCKQNSEKYAKGRKPNPNCHEADGETDHNHDDAHYYRIDPNKTLRWVHDSLIAGTFASLPSWKSLRAMRRYQTTRSTPPRPMTTAT
jgi:hypothetical protein